MSDNVDAKKKFEPEKILYIPHDNRPVVFEQTIQAIEGAGYKVITPPNELLGNRDNLGDPEKLWEWLNKNTKKDIKAAIISSDSLLYGSLVASRKHNFEKEIIDERLELFKEFRKDHKKLPIYVFGSIMRTPRSAAASGYEEPDYYRNYGGNIFRYTALKDKLEMEGLSKRESKELAFLEKLIPTRAIEDWMGRRKKNFSANEKLIDMTRQKIFNCLLLGRDDNAPYSQTHLENRYLSRYGATIEKNIYQTISGIDEVGIILLTRAINDKSKKVPTVFVKYNWGRGPDTIPAYSDEKIDTTIDAEILALSAKRISNESSADLILTVNTNPRGLTFESGSSINDSRNISETKYIVDSVQEYVDAGKAVAVADISFANGSDNSLMEQLKDRNLLFKINAYAGWNTPTNSTGFVLSEGLLSKKMTATNKKDILITRYLDDWAYQANIREIISSQLDWMRGQGLYDSLDDKRERVSLNCSNLMNHFVENNLSGFGINKNLRVEFPWNRMFEAKIKN